MTVITCPICEGEAYYSHTYPTSDSFWVDRYICECGAYIDEEADLQNIPYEDEEYEDDWDE